MPTAARRAREQARADSRKARQEAQAKYDAAGSGRRLSGWNPPASGPSRATEGQPKVRDRANDAARNDWVGASTAQKWTTALVGVGVTPRWDDESLTEHWEDHAKVCDADGACNAYALQALGVRTWFIGGEAFLRRRSRPTSLGLPAPVQFQLYESAQLPLFDADIWRGMPPSHDIRQGIERDIYGTRQAYWFHAQHPGELWSKGAPTPDQLVRVPADQVSHVFEPKRPGQLRGVSELAQILVRARASADFEDAVLDRQKLGNLFLAFIRRTMPPVDSVDFDDLTGLPKFYDKDRNPLVGMQPGMIQDLLPGEDVQFANPPEAGTTFSEYMRSTHLGTASGTGLPYELMSGDIANVSDRTLRVVINEFRRFAEQRQWHVVIPKLVDPMVRWWAEASLLSGVVSTRKFAAAAKPEYAPHGWEYIHPVQDIEGKIKAIDAGLTSVSAEVSKRGDDPKKVRQQRADDLSADEALGLKPSKPSGRASPR